MTTDQLDLFALLTHEDTGQVVRTPASPHEVHVGWRKNPDPRAWERDPATLRAYPVSEDHPFHLIYTGACRDCDWTTDGHDRENGATEAAMDHAWPGWRTLPLTAKPLTQVPDAQVRRWYESAVAAYPDGWVKAGGPVRTQRDRVASRSHWDAHYGFWDMGVVVDARP